MSKIPSPICFLEELDRKFIKWNAIAEDRTSPAYDASYDFNVEDYVIVDTYDNRNDYGDTITNTVVRRHSDLKHFRLEMYEDSWSDVYNGWLGECGNVYEVVGTPVTKTEWKDV